MLRLSLLTAVSVLALAASARADDAAAAQTQDSLFGHAIQSIRSWFGADSQPALQIQPAQTAGADDLQVPPPPNGSPADIEPAAGMDEDTLQVPPPYYGPQSNAGTPDRATAFDNNQSIAAFGGSEGASDLNAIQSAAGEGAIDRSKMDCDAILKAAAEAKTDADKPAADLIAACNEPAPASAATNASTDAAPVDPSVPAESKQPAQPGFEPDAAPQDAPAAPAQPLPATQPAAGEAPAAPAQPAAPAASADTPMPATLQ